MGSGPIVYEIVETDENGSHATGVALETYATEEEANADLAKRGEGFGVRQTRHWVEDGVQDAAPETSAS